MHLYYPLDKSEGEIKNGNSGDIGNNEYTKTHKGKTQQTQKIKKYEQQRHLPKTWMRKGDREA